jgi:hypothetical protein
MHNRRRRHNPSSRQFLRKQARKIRRTLVGRLDQVMLVQEVRARAELVPNHLGAAAPRRDPPQRRQILHRQDPRRELLRHLKLPASKGRVQRIRLAKVFLAVKQKIMTERQAVLHV